MSAPDDIPAPDERVVYADVYHQVGNHHLLQLACLLVQGYALLEDGERDYPPLRLVKAQRAAAAIALHAIHEIVARPILEENPQRVAYTAAKGDAQFRSFLERASRKPAAGSPGGRP